MKALPFYSMYIIPPILVLSVQAGGGWTYFPLFVLFVTIPAFDLLLGHERRNPPSGAAARGLENWLYSLALWLMTPVLFGLLAWTLWVATTRDYSFLELAGAALSMGVLTAGGGITVAHELMHRRDRPSRALAELLMSAASYPWFCVEHVHGHHFHVATPRDPASARPGESLYAFLPRSVFGGLRNSWRIERARARRQGIRPGSLRDRRARYAVLLGAIYGGLAWWLGWPGVLLFAAQSLVAVGMLETINYLEHYGLQRRETAPGRYEAVAPRHSWNSSHRLTNWFLFQLPRHADHHAAASRPYQALRHYDDCPQLPAGYPTMVLLALAPPLWRRIMDPRAAEWRLRGSLATATGRRA